MGKGNKPWLRGAVMLAILGGLMAALIASPATAHFLHPSKAQVKKVAKKVATQVFNSKIGPAIAGKQDRCADGALLAYARLDDSALNPAVLSTSGVTGFNCLGGAIEARNVSTGEYQVRIPGITTPNAVGVVAFVASGQWNNDADPDDNFLSYSGDDALDYIEVEQYDVGGTLEDGDFVIGVFAS